MAWMWEREGRVEEEGREVRCGWDWISWERRAVESAASVEM
jgi:hypothetical protein